MLCFRDRTFCNATECANFDACDRALTDEVLQAAERWWGEEGAPIAVSEFDCFDEEIRYWRKDSKEIEVDK